MKNLTLPGFVSVWFIHMKFIAYYPVALADSPCGCFWPSKGYEVSWQITLGASPLCSPPYSYVFLPRACCLPSYQPSSNPSHYFICSPMTARTSQGVSWVFINLLINFPSSFWFICDAGDSSKDARCNEFEGWMSLASSSTTTQVWGSGKQLVACAMVAQK